MMESGVPVVNQNVRRQSALSTPVPFFASVTTATTVYTGKADEFFLIRKLSVANTTGSPVALTLTVGADTYASAVSVAANSVTNIEGLEGHLITDGADIAGTGTGLNVFGWGLRIRGGSDNWIL